MCVLELGQGSHLTLQALNHFHIYSFICPSFKNIEDPEDAKILKYLSP